MKRLLYIFTAFCLLVTVFAPPASVLASASPSYAIESVEYEAEDTFTVNIGIIDNPGIISLRMSITYEDSAELISVADKKLLNGWTAPSATVSSPYTLRWADSLATENNTANGEIVALTFQLKETQTKPETFMLFIDHIEARNESGEKVYFSGMGNIINIAPPQENAIALPDGSDLEIDKDNALLSGVTPGTAVTALLDELTGGNIEIYKDGELLDGNDLVGTGCEVRLMDGNEILDSLTVVVKGDLDGDGKVNVPDARKALRAAVKLDTISDFQSLAADVDGSAKVEVPDARLILRVAVGLQSF